MISQVLLNLSYIKTVTLVAIVPMGNDDPTWKQGLP
jgi:hypothetical protein